MSASVSVRDATTIDCMSIDLSYRLVLGNTFSSISKLSHLNELKLIQEKVERIALFTKCEAKVPPPRKIFFCYKSLYI